MRKIIYYVLVLIYLLPLIWLANDFYQKKVQNLQMTGFNMALSQIFLSAQRDGQIKLNNQDAQGKIETIILILKK